MVSNEINDRLTAGDYQGTIFMIGDRQKSVIHSEPSIKEPRIFMAVVPGTYEQVQERRKGNENK